RNEIMQMMLLEPSLCILEETDSGLDIDALQVVASGVNAMRSPERSFIVVTHYQRLLDYIVPDFVHVLANGRSVRTGDKELARELEAKGYGWLEQEGVRACHSFFSIMRWRWLRGRSRMQPCRVWCRTCVSRVHRILSVRPGPPVNTNTGNIPLFSPC